MLNRNLRFGGLCLSLPVWSWRPKDFPGPDPGHSPTAASFSGERVPLPRTG